MASVSYIDDTQAGLPPSDRGFAYGDGLFETMLVREGRVRFLKFHLDRLESGCQRLHIPAPDRDDLAREIQARAPGRGESVMKLVLSRGDGPRGYAPPESPDLRVLFSVAALQARPAALPPVDTIVLRARLSENEHLAGIKHLCRLEQVIAAIELDSRSFEQGILLSYSGQVIGCANANLFLVVGESIVTPQLHTAGIEGVMRRAVIEACAGVGRNVEKRNVSIEELFAADGLFLTNALVGIREISSVDGHAYDAGRTVADIRRIVDSFSIA